jgi:hypothetical protein
MEVVNKTGLRSCSSHQKAEDQAEKEAYEKVKM